ncbi:MAG: glycosyltransferase family 1 protein [Candidatus Kapabacteria bacterium]|nr:glycosyltransferase family 1 protein [Candidatus Kapabacteria bacterium]
MIVCHVAGTAQRGQDGVTRVLYEYLERHRVAGLSPLVLTAVADIKEGQRFPMVELPAIRLPVYRDYKLYTGGVGHLARAIEQTGMEPSLIHLHTPCPLGRAALRYARRVGIPVIATYHTHFPSYVRHHRAGVLRPLVERSIVDFYSQCDRVLVPSRILCQELVQRGVRSAVYLPHGTDTVQFHPRWGSRRWRSLIGIPPDKIVLLYVGRLVWEKNLRILIEMWDRLDKRRYALVIVGTGPIESRLRRSMPGAIFLGYRHGQALAEAYASSDVFVFPSDTETFGNVTLEALASGLPCVVADAPGSAELVRHSVTGYRVDPYNAEQFVEAVEALANMSPEHRMLWRWRARLDAEQYQWSRVCADLFSHYRQLVEGQEAAVSVFAHTASLSSP